MSLFKIVLGDWSGDGHGQHEDVLIESNYHVAHLQRAYKKSCKLTGVSFNHNEDFTETNRKWEDVDKYHVCTEYEGSLLTPEIIEVFKKHGCPFTEVKAFLEEPYLDRDMFISLLMWFIGLSMPDNFLWERAKENIPCLNRQGKLKVQFGYGLFSE